MEPVDIASLLERVRDECLAGDVGPRTIGLSLESPARILGSEQELHSIAANLVSNAVKYTPADGLVRIRWWTDPSGGHLSVTDNGVGIAPEHLPRLTERFYRADQSRSREKGGSGLGLAIVKHALQRHGGRLSIDSTEGRGSTFTCHFPAKRVAAALAG
jgi:two-component system phosphate regulon sensor histidine kinase PhoR